MVCCRATSHAESLGLAVRHVEKGFALGRLSRQKNSGLYESQRLSAQSAAKPHNTQNTA